MNVKKIIKGIIGLGAIGGVAYAAYKLGESDGRFNEIHRRMTENGDEDDEDIEVEKDDDYRFYDNYDEPDDGCIAPIDFGKMNDAPAEKYEDSKCCSADKDTFAPFSSVQVNGISESDFLSLLYQISARKYISNKAIREYLDVDTDKAAEVLSVLYHAGYIASETGKRIPVRLTISDYFSLIRGDRK